MVKLQYISDIFLSIFRNQQNNVSIAFINLYFQDTKFEYM